MSLLPRRPSADPRALRRSVRPLVASLGFVVLAGLLPVAAVAPVAAGGPKGGAGLQPTIHYEEAQAHAHDDLHFTPGGRVTVPFRPRATDHWKVGGRAPRALPAGRVSGRAMRTLDVVPAAGSLDGR